MPTQPPGAARRSRTWLPVAAAAAGVALLVGATITAINLAGAFDDPPVTPTPAPTGPDAALTSVVNPSDAKGGTLRLLHSGDFDSLDPGDMYLASSWNFSRLYARPLLTYTGGPGARGGGRLAPDLAMGRGQASADLKTWTYRLRSGLKYEDGTPVTAADVRYAVARTFATDVLSLGPGYFRELLDAGDYAGPYEDGGLDGFTGVTAPDAQTVVFHLKEPYAEFDHVAAMPQTAPVPQAKDTGADYGNRPFSTGPFKVEGHQEGKSITLVRNTAWSGDSVRKQLADRIEVTLNVGGDELDQRLLAGSADLDVSGVGLQAQSRTRALADPAVKEDTDSAPTGFLRYIALSTKVAPFDNVHCRRAVQYAVDRTAIVQTVFGGPRPPRPRPACCRRPSPGGSGSTRTRWGRPRPGRSSRPAAGRTASAPASPSARACSGTGPSPRC